MHTHKNTCFHISGSFVVINAETMDDIISNHHRKEEISDIKFSPGKKSFNYPTRLKIFTC